MDSPFEEGDIASEDGKIPFQIPEVKKSCFTYYKVFGDLSSGKTPLVALHGGPGSSHRATQDFAVFWPRCGIPVIVYDQIGGAMSTNLDDEKAGDEAFWQPSLFKAELENLLNYFGLKETGFDLLGLSWGAMLGADFATSRPKGLRRLVLGSPAASIDLLVQGVSIRKGELPQLVQQALDEGIEKQQWRTEAFKEAYQVYFAHCMCRADPLPPRFGGVVDWAVSRTTERDTTTATMLGPNPVMTLKSMGSLRDWDITSQLHRIIAPTLVWNGEFDQCHDIGVQPLFDHIPKVRWYTFPGASHILTYETEKLREDCFNLVGGFLTQADSY